jgi:AAA family ATP:ADP antiporter
MLTASLKRIAQSMWGKFESREELFKFLQMAAIFGLIIGVYWALRPMKDSIFDAIIGGKKWLWSAKIVSLLVNVPLVIVYSKLTDIFPRHKFFCFLTIFYGVATLGFAWAFNHEQIGLANLQQDPYRFIGWAWYVFVESFGSLVVALFWAIATDITKPEAAKRGFPLIGLFAQLANMVFPYFLTAKKLNFTSSAPVVAICGSLMILMALLMMNFIRTTPAKDLMGYSAGEHEEEAGEPGFFEGLKLLLTKGYLLGIFFVVTIYEIIITIVDNHFKVTAFSTFTTETEVAQYLSKYAYTTGIVGSLCVILGINNIQRRLGMAASLMLLPPLVGLAVLAVKFNPNSLNVVFWIMVFSKAVNYALNQPTMKQLYIPTTKDTKYKATAWIETFGSRLSKAGGSAFAGFRPVWGVATFLSIAAAGSLSLIVLWLFIAMYVSKKYNKAIKDNTVVC